MNEMNVTAPPPAPAAARESSEIGPRYDFAAAEPKWQKAWTDNGCFRVEDVPTDGKPKY
ncbi:MAG: leucyl-tRNA synthetase, partial [Acetobacteraceae bacterium]|nr:leucyl-tRNA synthetase [Acetobacteraceae bacterium]